MMQKRIGVVMYQTSNSKGQELVAQRMVRYFNKMGQKAYLITSVFHDGKEVVSTENLRRGRSFLFSDDNVLKIPVIRVDSYMASWPPRRIVFRDFIHVLENIVEEYELNVLITHSTLWNGPEEVAKFVAWRRDMRNMGGYKDPIVFCHMSHFQEPSPARYSIAELTFRTAWNKLSLSKIMDTANKVLVVTPFEKISKIKMGAKQEKVFLFPGGIDDEVFLSFAAAGSNDFLTKHNIKQGTKIISYLGTIEERKNPIGVLKVAGTLQDRQDILFVIAGKGGSSYAEEMIKIAHRLPNVIYVGEINENEKVQLIKSSYLNIIMSRLEALGIAQLEFMYCGVPVITSATGGQSWVIQHGVEGLHVKSPDDIDGAANAIIKLIENNDIYTQLSNNAKEKASKLTVSRLTAELDSAIDTEMLKESGLTAIPTDVQETLAKSEYTIKTKRVGSWGVVATNKRIFIRQGVISRKVTELRYDDIKSIEHSRRYPWRTLLWGAIISAFILIAPSLQPIFSKAFVSGLQHLWQNIAQSIPAWLTTGMFTQVIFPLLPLFIGLILFILGIKAGFKLYSDGIKPLYLPRQFKEIIGFIREMMDKS
jgi:glycosyltransferase involved in cell wall biosynthesis